MKSKELMIIILTSILIVNILSIGFVFASESSTPKLEPVDLVLPSGGTGGDYYPMLGAIGALITEKIETVKSATPQVTAASVENLRLLERGIGDLALASGQTVASAMLCTGGFEGQESLKNIRVICWGYASLLHIMVPKNFLYLLVLL